MRDGNTARPLPYDEPSPLISDDDAWPEHSGQLAVDFARLNRADWLMAALLALAVGTGCFLIANTLPPYLLQSMDFWFESDTVREVSNMTSRTDDHSRTSVHPLFSILTFTPVYLAKQALGVPPLQAVLHVTGLMGGLWAATLFLLLRLLGCRKLDGSIFTALGLSSASAIFWLPVPNSYTWGSWSIMIALALLLFAEQRRFGATAYVAASAFTLSITVTNWMAGLLATLARWPLKQTVQLSINAFCLVVLLWGAQKFMFPSAEFFIGGRTEANWVNHPQAGGKQNIVSAFAFHTLVAPAIRFIDDDGFILFGDDSFRLSQRLSFQFSAPGSAGPLGLIAVGLWSVLLLNGLWRMVTLDRQLRFRLVLAAMLLFEFSLHMVYGEETFTYSLNFIPLLLAVAALGALSPGRPLVLVAAGLLALCAGLNNWHQFQDARAQATHFTPQRDAMTSMMQKDPDRPWPRSVGHVPLALPGSSEGGHAYHEPGGDFSPQTPSFGISLWLCDATGHPVMTSQTLPLSEIRQTFALSEHSALPAIVTRTPYYEASWSRVDATGWELRLKNLTSHIPAILIRSVGPAGGPVTALSWDGKQVAVNHRWTVALSPAPAGVALGDENSAGWMTAPPSTTSWEGESGWGYARLLLPPDSANREYRLILSDSRVPVQMNHWYKESSPRMRLSLPDSRFQASMDAQVTHLMMSLIGRETRPGDPVFFYRAWQRQGAYITAALARTGDPHVSRVLSQFVATHDFAGGDGPEADAPGVAIWSLTQAAAYIADKDYDRWLWPHILRKAHRIEEMLRTRESIEETFLVPTPYDISNGQQTSLRVLAQPARDGLIVGRVGNEWPSLYVNAVSYQGLVAASELADRLGKQRDAARWRDLAAALQTSWQHRTAAGPLHVADSRVDARHSPGPLSPRSPLEQPLPLYSPTPDDHSPATTMIVAHHLLRSGRPDALWALLDQLWERQASPGLYTWDAPRPATSDVADGWQYVRGWHNQRAVSPDYQTAALLLLLQQDMLAYVDDRTGSAALVIGGGIPPSWLTRPMAVSGLAIPGGSVDWQWDGHTMQVHLQGPSRTVRLGAAFPDNTELSVTPHPLTS